ncbi:MAG TPA: MFS transporter [Pseudonocardiaceae bacterium]
MGIETRSPSPPPSTSMRGGAAVLLAVGAAVTVGTLPVFLVGGLAVQLRAELGLSMSLLGLAGAMFFAASALAARPLATVTERIGPTTALRIAVTGSAVCLAALAAAPSTPWLLAGLGLAGIPAALSQPAANELLMARVPPQRRGFAFAVKQSAIPVSTLLAGLAVPAVALTVGWRWVFLLAGVLGLLAMPTVPRLRWRRPARSEPSAGGSVGWLLVAMAVVTTLGAAAATTLGTFVTISAVGVGYDEAAAGLLLSLGSAVGLTARLAAGAVADRAKPDLLRMVAVMLALGGVGYLLLAANQPIAFLVGLVLGFGAGWAWPGVFNYAVAARFPDRVATSTSVTQTGVYAGAAGGPLLFGLVAEHAGTPAAWLASAVLTALATATLIVVRARSR